MGTLRSRAPASLASSELSFSLRLVGRRRRAGRIPQLQGPPTSEDKREGLLALDLPVGGEIRCECRTGGVAGPVPEAPGVTAAAGRSFNRATPRAYVQFWARPGRVGAPRSVAASVSRGPQVRFGGLPRVQRLGSTPRGRGAGAAASAPPSTSRGEEQR
ncbi:hypothetical protein NDU88_005907 [Pleurodeles waltl]|uniref:Uncharacterized protein n=1 Tax=Pleurodeles waltl TaxID=8319 RepID=A0AAV7NXV9_PLEWA|nr:hypothetical protein NDU88_005907 [Pleurodeles waltl]